VWKTPCRRAAEAVLYLLERRTRITQATYRKGCQFYTYLYRVVSREPATPTGNYTCFSFTLLVYWLVIQLRHEEAISVEPLKDILVITY
jgi:hypothetical protein